MFMDAAPRGEAMGTAADGSSLAAHTPIVHAFPIRFETDNKAIPEGTLLQLYARRKQADVNCKRSATDCTEGQHYVLTGRCTGSKGGSNDFATRALVFYRPTASEVHAPPNSEGPFVQTASLALQSVTRIALDGIRGKATKFSPGQRVFVHHPDREDDGKVQIALTSSPTGASPLGVVTLPCDTAAEPWMYVCLHSGLLG